MLGWYRDNNRSKRHYYDEYGQSICRKMTIGLITDFKSKLSYELEPSVRSVNEAPEGYCKWCWEKMPIPELPFLTGLYKDGVMQVKLDVPKVDSVDALVTHLCENHRDYISHAVMSSGDHLNECFRMSMELGEGIYLNAEDLLASLQRLEIFEDVCSEVAHYIVGHGDIEKNELVEVLLGELRRVGTPTSCGMNPLPDGAVFGSYRKKQENDV